MVSELSSGPCIAIEIRGDDAPQNFREFCGPADPVIFSYFVPIRPIFLSFGRLKVKARFSSY